LCWFCPVVGCLSYAKLFAHSMSQDCALVNHCLPIFIPYVGGILMSVSLRHNTRVKNNIGLPAMDVTGIVGDTIMSCLCGPCVACQELRAVDREAWDWMTEMSNKGFIPMVEPIVCCIEKA